MFKNLSVQKKLYFGFAAIFTVLLILLGVAYSNLNRVGEANEWDKHTLIVMLDLERLRSNVVSIQSATRGYVITGNEKYLDQITHAKAALNESLKNVQFLTIDNATQQDRLNKKFAPLMQDWLSNTVQRQITLRQEIKIKNSGTPDLDSFKALLDQANVTRIAMEATLDDCIADESRLLEERSKRTHSLKQDLTTTLLFGSAIAAVLSTLIALFLSRAILSPLRNLTDVVSRIAAGDQTARAAVMNNDELGFVTSEFNRMAQAVQDNQEREKAASDDLLKDKVNDLLVVVSKAADGDFTSKIGVSGQDAVGQLGHGLSSMFDDLRGLLDQVQKAGILVTISTTEIAAAARQQEATSVEQAQTSVEVLSTTKEIAANSKQLLKTMEEATKVSDYTAAATVDAQNNLKRMDDTMQRMVNATDSINAKLATLSDKASNINKVLTTITKVADQTNLLSLNAAIEAEKAGEAGRGFSVVATEIRRLADQTSVSTWDIEQMIKEMQSAVSASVMGMDKFSEEIRRSVTEVKQVGDQLSGVIEQVQKLAPHFENVLQGMQSQSIGADQITETMMQLNDMTQQTTESLRSTSEAIQQLQLAAKDMQVSVSKFKVTA